MTTNPATGEVVARFPTLDDAEVDTILVNATSAYVNWKAATVADRSVILNRVADLHADREDELAALVTLEMGKPISQARGEVALAGSIYRYYAENGERLLADEALEIAGSGDAVVRSEPIGPLVGIMPWNYPHYQVARFVAPNLVLGNTIILKHASNCPQSALAIAELLRDAGVPDGVYQNAFASTDQVAAMVADSRVHGVSLTGSERAGSAIGEIAGRHMKKYVLELGGSDPFIVLEDADIDLAADAAALGRMSNAGQACTASKRFLVVDSIYEEFLLRFVRAMAAFTAGDPTDRATKLGPLASTAAVDDIAALVDDAVSKGATVHTGGIRSSGSGAYYPATVLSGVHAGMRAHTEELFGPVAVVYRVADADAAVSAANSSDFGLASSVFSANVDAARKVAARLETGMVWINSISRSAPDLPFGGVKRSGVGRELARFGIDEFANKKLVRVPEVAS